MKLVTLNAWGGRAFAPLMEFLRRRGRDVDVFCLQEMFDCPQEVLVAKHPEIPDLRGDVFRRACEALPDHEGSLAYFDDDRNRMTLALFVRRGVEVHTIEDFIVHRPANPIETGSAVRAARKLQYVTLGLGGRECTVANFHGLWVNGPKTDTPERLDQAHSVRTFLDGVRGPAILAGDFNLLPETESLAIMAKGMKNHVRESGVDSTRTPLYRHFKNPAEPNFADYVLTTPDVAVKDFAVLPDVVSDHAPLYLEFG